MKKKIVLSIILITLTLLLLGYKTIKLIAEPGEYDEFARCLSSKNITMYGTDWCRYCKKQKSMFGKSFKYVNYVNCDYEKIKCKSAV